MNKKYRTLISFVLVIVLAVIFTIGGLKMQNVYGDYLIEDDELMQNVIDYSASNTHSLYVYQKGEDQRLFVKGANACGQLGTKDYDDYTYMAQILVGLPASKISKVWALTNASFIQTEDGKIYAAGDNNFRKLGIASEENTINVFTEVMIPLEAIGHIVDIQGNGNFTIFKTDIGKFYGSGDNTHGQLGFSDAFVQASDINGNPVVEIATEVVDGNGNPVVVKDIAAGLDFTVLIDDTQDGNIYFTGNNSGNATNGAKQSATDYLDDTVFGFTFVTNVKQYDSCHYHRDEISPNNFYIYASDETYAVINGMIVVPEFRNFSIVLENYVVGEEVFPEIFLFSSIYEDIDVSKFSIAFPEHDIFRSALLREITGDDSVHGVKYADYILADSGDYQILHSKSAFKLLNEGILFWFKSRYTGVTYLSYFGKNNPESSNYIPWLKNTGLLYIEENTIKNGIEDTEITNISVSQKTLLYTAESSETTALYAAGDNTNGLINPLDPSVSINILDSVIMVLKQSDIKYPLYIYDISPEQNTFLFSVGDQETVTFNSINKPRLNITEKSETDGKNVSDIVGFTKIIDGNNILKGLEFEAKGAGTAIFEIYDESRGIENPVKLFNITVSVTAPPTVYNMSFEAGASSVNIGESIDVVFLAPLEFTYGEDFELRVSNSDILTFSTPVPLGTASDNRVRYFTIITPVTSVEDTADLEIWVLGEDTQCLDTKTIAVTEPVIERIDIDFASNMPTSIDVGETINVMQYVTPVDQSSNMTYSVVSGNEHLVKISSTIGMVQGLSEGVATIRINHPRALTYKEFTIIVNAVATNPQNPTFTINSSITSVDLELGDSRTITYVTNPSGQEEQVVISSDNNEICTVDTQNKTITAVGVGNTYIRLSSPNATSQLTIPVAVRYTVILSVPETITIAKGTEVQIPVLIQPESEKQGLVFHANNSNVDIGENGYITGVDAGTSVVTVSHPLINSPKYISVTVLNIEDDDNNNEPVITPTPRLVLLNVLNDDGEIEVAVDEEVRIIPYIENNYNGAIIEYALEDTSIASVLISNIKGLKVGKTTLTISAGEEIAPIRINVNVVRKAPTDNVVRYNIALSTTSMNLEVGSSGTINYATNPSGYENQVTITSDDTNICTVNASNRTVTAVRVGNTYIRLSGINANSSVAIPVSVTAKETAPVVTFSVPKTIAVKNGEQVQIPVSVHPESERANIRYSAGNSNVKVDQSGYITGNITGQSTVTVSHPSAGSQTITVTVLSSEGDTKDDSSVSSSPRIVLGNTLNKNGELEVILGGKIDLTATVENYDGVADIKYTATDSSKISVVGTKLRGESQGKATLEISTNVVTKPLIINVVVLKASYTEEEISVNIDEIKTEDEKQQESQSNIEITLNQYQQYKINLSGSVKNVDVDEYFDSYFHIKTTEKYVSYLGKGIIRANYPGETIIYIYKSDRKTLVGKAKVTIPYPNDFFSQMPTATGIPFNRTIRITFNQNILPSSVTEASVFVQNKSDGNGKSLKRTVSVTNNVLNIYIPMTDKKEEKTETVYIFILPEVKSVLHVPIYSPIVIPVTFVN